MPSPEYTQEEMKAAEIAICVGGREAGLAFFTRHPHIGWVVACVLQLELTRANSCIAQLEKKVGNE